MKTPPPGTILVRFVQAWSIYRAGELAGFTDKALVQRLVAFGAAQIVNTEAKIEEVQTEAPVDTMKVREATVDSFAKHDAVVTEQAQSEVASEAPAKKPRWLKK
jgi:hypothetical protein